MEENSTLVRRNDSQLGPIAMILLAMSFFVLGIFRAFEAGNGSTLVAENNTAVSTYWSYVVFMALLGWVVFELVLRLYYFFVSMSIYTFTIPKKGAFSVFRMVFAARNLIVAGFSFLLFVYPLFSIYLAVVTLVVDFLSFVCAFVVIKKKYLNELLSPFAWKAFLRPFVIYETLILVVRLMGGVL